MQLQPQLEKAVRAEIAYCKNLVTEQAGKPIAELRKEGLCLEPAKVEEIRSDSRGYMLTIRTSYVIPATYFRRGARVHIQFSDQVLEGSIFEVDAYTIQVVIHSDTPGTETGASVRVDFIPDDRTLRCLEYGVHFLLEKEELQQFENALCGPVDYSGTVEHPDLNLGQQAAIHRILNTPDVAVIQGPPGTGKTHTLSVAIELLIGAGKRILVSAPSNTAVDNLARTCLQRGLPILRIGNEEKIADDLLPFSLDEQLLRSKHGSGLDSMRQQLTKWQQIADRHIRNYTSEAAEEKRNARKEVNQLRKEIRQEEKALERLILEQSNIICGTPVALFNVLQKQDQFDTVMIDEAGQCMSPLVWLLAVFADKLILCGDPQQLPPVVLSNEAKLLGLGTSILEASYQLHPPLMLETQYRMAEPISTLISQLFYGGKLAGIPGKHGSLTFLDTAGYDAVEQTDDMSGSYSNPTEVKLVEQLLYENQLTPENTVIIAPYSAQIELLRKALPQWSISTIDSIQGQEQENVLVSLVRSNEDGTIGFLKDYRRTNVALSRTQNNCWIIGDSATLSTDRFYAELFDLIEQHGTYRSAWEFSL